MHDPCECAFGAMLRAAASDRALLREDATVCTSTRCYGDWNDLVPVAPVSNGGAPSSWVFAISCLFFIVSALAFPSSASALRAWRKRGASTSNVSE